MAREAAGTGVHRFRKWAAALSIAAVACVVAMLLSLAPRFSLAIRQLVDVFYDTFYQVRPTESRRDGPVIVITVDDASLQTVDKVYHYGWPWPRETWGDIVTYLDRQCHPKAIVFDMWFTEKSKGTREDDAIFAKALDESKTAVILAGPAEDFSPPGKERRIFGAVNV